MSAEYAGMAFDAMVPEPSVQVPVSLIERAKEALLELPPSSRNADVYGELHGLSQPTPTAEPPITTHEYESGRFGDDGFCHAVVRPYEPTRCHRRRSEHAAPPSIADMAPGTRPCADPNVNRWYCMRGADGNCPRVKCIERGANLDPSTIRDVTPPKEPS